MTGCASIAQRGILSRINLPYARFSATVNAILVPHDSTALTDACAPRDPRRNVEYRLIVMGFFLRLTAKVPELLPGQLEHANFGVARRPTERRSPGAYLHSMS
jgi:hypothetical protein